MIKKYFVLLILLFSVDLFAYCYYVPCAPSTQVATTITTTNVETITIKINKQLMKVRGKYSEYGSLIAKNNGLYGKNKENKKDYLKLTQHWGQSFKR